jgi:ribonuclease E
MSKKMLIDAGHSEETRVVVVDGTKVEEFDFESAARKPIRGNIYLAKVTRVEPSLQAAFVEYGGNRHGFLAFNEIHPDYYQIPYEDRLALAEEEATAVAEEEAEADAKAESKESASKSSKKTDAPSDEAEASDEDGTDATDETGDSDEDTADAVEDNDSSDDDEDDVDEQKAARRRRQLYRKYKIQEVIKRRQVLLVQAAKEERGNKGAALTTYLSLAGRYCVLMPNTPRGGGISRKISNVSDRKRLKSVVSELELPKGVGLIIRTAGASRTKVEIRRDADYLTRLWENIRELTLKSVAPSLIYEEGNLVKRAIRDMYDKEIDGVLVQGDDAYKEAKAFMKMLMPSHAKNVQHYKESVPLFLRHRVETQLEANYSPTVPLKSGGYLVINPTEALVSVDVNSGRSTRERNIETTALKTNLEAATEVARQMRLRDLAGLIVIDFIDMDENRNNRAVEKRMKDVLKRDRARLQVGRISQFGLMEISRQRRRSSILEGSTHICPTCQGIGHVRSVESSALVALRGLEEEGLKGRSKRIRLTAPTAVVLYLLNDKRDHLLSIEANFEMRVSVASDDTLNMPDFTLEPLETRKAGEELVIAPLSVESIEEIDTSEMDAEPETQSSDEGAPETGGRKRRRRRRRRGSGSGEDTNATTETSNLSEAPAEAKAEGDAETPTADGEDQPRRRRRGRRGGRGRRRGSNSESAENAANASPEANGASETGAESGDAAAPVEAQAETSETSDTATQEDSKRRRPRRRRKTEDAANTDAAAETNTAETSAAEAAPEAPASDEAVSEEKPKRRARRPRKKADADTSEAKTEETSAATAPAADGEEDAPAKPKRRTRRKKAEPAAEVASEAPSAAKPDESATEDAPKAKPRTRAKAKPKAAKEKAAAEPKPEAAPAPVEAEKSDKPQRKGWWNRTGLFGK